MIHQEIYLYEDREDVKLVTYVQNPSRFIRKQDPKAAVIICPGGSYQYISEREGEPIALAFAKAGFQAFVLHYSVGGHILSNGLPASVFPQPMRDLAQAMNIVHQRAEEWLIDKNKIGCCGFSAGGHLVASYANQWADEEMYGFNRANKPFQPAFSLLAYPFTNYYSSSQELEKNKDRIDPSYLDWAKQFIVNSFGQLELSQEQLMKWSPALGVNKNTPASFIWACQDDSVVRVDQSIQLLQALNKKQIKTAFHLFSSGGHGLALATEATAVIPEQVNNQAQCWLPLALNWLKKEVF